MKRLFAVFILLAVLFCNFYPSDTLCYECSATCDTEPNNSGIITYLVVGFDEGGENTDSIVLMNYNSFTNSFSLMQIPRDTYFAHGESGVKINRLFAYYLNKGYDRESALNALCSDISDSLGISCSEFLIITIRKLSVFDVPITKDPSRRVLTDSIESPSSVLRVAPKYRHGKSANRQGLIKEALVVSHSELSLKLSEGLKHNANDDYQGSTAEGEYAGKRLSIRLDCSPVRGDLIGGIPTGTDPLKDVLNYVRAYYYGNYCNDAEEQSTCKSDLVEYLSDIIRGGSTLSDTVDSAALLFQVVRNLYRIEGDLSIEVSEGDDQNEKHDRINEAIRAEESCAPIPEAVALAAYAAKSKDGGKERNDRACEDDRHNTGHIKLDRKLGALTAVHLTAYSSLCILNRNPSLGAGHPNYEYYGCNGERKEHNCEEDGYECVPEGILVAEGGITKIEELIEHGGE